MDSEEKNEVNEPVIPFGRNLKIFNSFEEQAEYELKEMASLTPFQWLIRLRQFINIAYGMHGYNPDALPIKYEIEIKSS
ncbi:MAG: hypothetical protein ACHQK8_02740 [Bacteroidia bacterium]